MYLHVDPNIIYDILGITLSDAANKQPKLLQLVNTNTNTLKSYRPSDRYDKDEYDGVLRFLTRLKLQCVEIKTNIAP